MKLWNKKDIDFIKDNYKTMKYREIAKILNRSTKAIKHQISNLKLFKKINGRLYIDNSEYFQGWTNNIAYITGYLMADGHIKSSGRTLVCRCKEEDRIILDFIKNEIGPNRPISVYNNNSFPCAVLSITDNKICNDLLKYNIFPRKTGKETLPNIPEEFKGDYLRGLFDGDGCISVQKFVKDNKYLCTRNHWFICSSSKDFLEEVNNNLCNNLGKIRLGKTCYGLHITNRKNIYIIYNLMYSFGSFRLERKYNKFLELGFK